MVSARASGARTRGAGADRFSRTIHANNAEMAMRVSEALNMPMRFIELDDDWATVVFEHEEGGDARDANTT